MTTLAARNPGLTRLLVGQVPADLADWLTYVAVASALTYGFAAPPIAFAFFAVALGLPYLTVGLAAGALVDRWPLGAVLVGSNLGRALAAAALMLAPNWQVLVFTVFVIGSVDSFFTPAKQAAIQALVAEGDRGEANGRSHAINQVAKIIGPALGGALLGLLPGATIFLLPAVASAIAATLYIGLPLPERARDGKEAGILSNVVEGARLVRQVPLLRLALILMGGLTFGMFVYDTLIPPLIASFGFDAQFFGLSMSAVGAGGVIGALLAGRVLARLAPLRVIGPAALTSTAIVAAMGLMAQLGRPMGGGLLLGAFFSVGITSALTLVPLRTLVQNAAPEEAMARVSSLIEAATMTALLIAPFLGAALAARFGPGSAFVAGAGVAALMALLAIRAGRHHASGMKETPP